MAALASGRVVAELVAGAGVVVAARLVWHHATVPRVVGMQVTATDAVLRRTGLTPEVSGAFYSGRVARGGVISQLPRSGAREKTASIVKMVISEGRHPASLPSLAGMTEAMAGTAVRRAHLVPQFFEQYSETVALGAVVSSNAPAGSRVFYGDTVDVVNLKGPEPQLIPADLSGGVLTSMQADSILTNLQLRPIDDQEYSNSVPLGYVISTKPASGQIVPGHSTVQVFVSAGPAVCDDPVAVRRFGGRRRANAGLFGSPVDALGPPSTDFVLSQLPAAGTSARVGSRYLLPLLSGRSRSAVPLAHLAGGRVVRSTAPRSAPHSVPFDHGWCVLPTWRRAARMAERASNRAVCAAKATSPLAGSHAPVDGAAAGLRTKEGHGHGCTRRQGCDHHRCGPGIGREHALLFAAEGAKVVVNDLGCAVNGSGDDRTAAQRVVDEIKQIGGDPIANTDDVADWDGGHHVVSAANEAFGDLHMLVNNAGIIRDRVLVNMTRRSGTSSCTST